MTPEAEKQIADDVRRIWELPGGPIILGLALVAGLMIGRAIHEQPEGKLLLLPPLEKEIPDAPNPS